MGITDFEKLNKWEDRHCLKYNIVLRLFKMLVAMTIETIFKMFFFYFQ